MIQDFLARLWRPVWIYGIFGSACGLALVLITPPFEVPDEPNHFYRAYQVSEGDVVSLKEADEEEAGGQLPTSLRETAAHTLRGIPFHPRRKYSLSWTTEAFDFELKPERTDFYHFPNTALYSPVAYLPQASAIAIARVFEPPPMTLFYLGRVAALAFAVGLGCWALHMTPCLQWPLLLLLMMPMTMFETASVSADAATNALSIAFFASMLSGVSESSDSASTPRKALWIGLFVLVTLAKTVYAVLGLLILLVPPIRFGGRRRQLAFLAAFFVLGGSAFLGWSWVADSLYVPFHPDQYTDMREQLRLVMGNPLGFVQVVLRSLQENHEAYRHMFVGNLGWLDTPLPPRLLDAYAMLLVLAALLDGRRDWKLDGMRKAWVGLTAAAGLLGVCLSLYCLWTAVGSPVLDSLQGRYFIPLAPVVLLTFYNTTLAGAVEDWHKAAITIPVLGMTWLITFYRLLQRYYAW